MKPVIKFLLGLFVLLTFTQTASADWATARYSSDNSGATPYIISEPIETLWESQEVGHIIANPVVDGENNIYLNVYNQGLKALDKNGSVRWMGPFSIRENPVIDQQGNLYASEGSCGSFVYSLDKNGQERWRFRTRPEGEPCGNFNPGLVALSRDQKTVYSSRSYPGKTVLALNTQNGNLVWEQGLNGHSPEYVSVGADETVYVGTGGSGYLFALGPAGIKWQGFTSGGSTVIAQTPMLDSSGNVYAVSKGAWPADSIVSFTPAGVRRWIIRAREGTTIDTLPALKNQRLYFSEGRNIKAVATSNGAIIWEWTAPLSTIRSLSPLAIDAAGNIYGALANKLFVIDENGQTKNSLTVGTAENYLRWVIIPQDDLILLTKHHPSGPQGFVVALGKKPAPTKTPLILIPGIGGSELKTAGDTIWSKDDGHGGTFSHAYPKDEKVWVNEGEAAKLGEDDYFDVLRMKTDGITSEANIGIGGSLVMRAYGEAINFFNSNDYQLNKDFFIFPYDWRLDNSLNVNELDKKIQEIKNLTGSEKVDIVAHSMGGLIARSYISDPTKASNVRKLFTLGTPHLGAVSTLKKLRYGECLTPIPVSTGPFCLGITPSEVKDVLQNMISGYQLSPSQTYFNFYSDEDNNHPYPYKTEAGSLNYQQIKNYLTNLEYNTLLYNPSETFHGLDNSLSNTNGVDVIIIAGSGQPTLGQIVELTLNTLGGSTINFKDKRDINGDGTVPLLSASIADPHKGLFLNGSAQVFYANQEHGELVVNGPALNLVKNILNGDNQLPNDISTQPYKITGYGLSVHSPVNIHVYDQNNNHTGPLLNGDFEANIPGSSYDTLGDAKFIFLPDDGQYTIIFEALDNGSFDFKVRRYEDDVNTETIFYNDVPINSTSTGQTILDTQSSNPPTLQIDQQNINASATLTGNANYDQTPPVTTVQLSGIQGNNNWFRSDITVTLEASDESGIDKIEYTLDNGQTVQTYTNPFTISQEGILKLKFKATDKAGNEENPQEVEIKIDKTPLEALVQFNLTTQNLEINGNEITPGEVILTDEAGNTTRLQVEPKERKRKEKLEIKTISYNDGSPIKLPDNKFEVKFKKDLDQTIKINGEEKIKAKYNQKKNITKIEIKEQGEKKRVEERSGIVLLQLLTNQGQLTTNF